MKREKITVHLNIFIVVFVLWNCGRHCKQRRANALTAVCRGWSLLRNSQQKRTAARSVYTLAPVSLPLSLPLSLLCNLYLSLSTPVAQPPPLTKSTNWGVEMAADWSLRCRRWLKRYARAEMHGNTHNMGSVFVLNTTNRPSLLDCLLKKELWVICRP